MTSLRSALRAGDQFVATFVTVDNPAVVELAALAGFDAVVLDTEHGPFGTEALTRLITAADARGVPALVRVRTNDPSLIGAALDAGAAGVVVPQVTSAGEAAAAVAAARFAPMGTRGANPYVRAADYDGNAEWFARSNEETAVVLMVEGVDGIAALPQILNTPGLDCVFVGPVDLSHALGHPGYPEHSEVIAAVERIVASASSAGVATGVFAPTSAAANRWLALGVGLVAFGIDANHMLNGLRSARQSVVEADKPPR